MKNPTRVKMLVGEDLRLEHALSHVEKTLIRHFFGVQILNGSLHDWVNRFWKPIVGYRPSFHVVIRLCLNFSFS